MAESSSAATAAATTAANEGGAATLPRNAQNIVRILHSMGVDSYEPRVINMLLEFSHRYSSQVLRDARFYADYAQRSNITVDDVKLAIQSKVDSSFTQPPPREFMARLAKDKNSQPLPRIDFRPGIRLPPEQFCLTADNYQMSQPNRIDDAMDTTGSSGINGVSAAPVV